MPQRGFVDALRIASLAAACTPTSRAIRPVPLGFQEDRSPYSAGTGQCPEGTYVDNSEIGRRAFHSEVKDIPGAVISTTGEGERRATCRQKCPDSTSPRVEYAQSDKDGTTTWKYSCDA